MANDSTFALADIIAVGALLVSIWSARHASNIEKRLRKQDEKKAAFDQWIQNPVDSKLTILEQCVYKITIVCAENSDKALRVEAIRKIQITEFDNWFVGFEALCENQGDTVLALIKQDLFAFLDDFLELLNAAQSASDGADISDTTKNMIRREQQFVSRTKEKLLSARLALK